MRQMGLLFFICFAVVSVAHAQQPESVSPPVPTDAQSEPASASQNNAPAAPASQPLGGAQEARPNVIPQLDGESFSLLDALKAFVKTILMLLVVLLVAYVLLGKGLPKLMNKTMKNSRMKVLERLPLDQKRMLFLVEVDGQTYLLGGADGQVSLIDKSEDADTNFEQKLKLQKAANDAMKEVG